MLPIVKKLEELTGHCLSDALLRCLFEVDLKEKLLFIGLEEAVSASKNPLFLLHEKWKQNTIYKLWSNVTYLSLKTVRLPNVFFK